MFKFNPYAIPPLITALFCLIIGAFVYLKNRKSSANRAFGILGFSCFLWNLGYFMSYISTAEKSAYFWCQFAYLGIAFITPATYHFSVAFVKIPQKNRIITFFYLLAFIFALLTRTSLLVNGVTMHYWGYHTKIGVLHNIFLIFWITPLIMAFRNLRLGYLSARLALERQRAKYMFWAISFGYLGGLDYLAHYGIEIYPIGFAPVIIFILATAYAIVRYRIMDISIVITRAAVFLAVYSIVLGIPFILSAVLKEWFMRHLGTNWWMGPFSSLVMLGTIGPFVYVYLEKKAESILLREQRRYQETLKHVAVDLSRIRNLQKLIDYIAQTVTEVVRISHAIIYVLDAKKKVFLLKAGTHVKDSQPQSIEHKNILISWLEKNKEPLVYEEIKHQAEDNSKQDFKKLEEQMRKLNAAVIVPCFLQDKIFDILILGEKLSGKIYNSDDLLNFSFLASEAALATENAQLYGKIEEEVKQRTEELVDVQKQLVHAEKLATVGTLAGGVAHEINNPLTAILTNVQILLATCDTLDIDSKESLELIEEATKRCRTIVQKLMAYAKKPLEESKIGRILVSDILNKVIAFLSYQFEQDNIKIDIEEKERNCFVLGNQNELEQVITNILINAKDAIIGVKKSGTIHVSVAKSGKWIKMLIKDEGSGIPKEIISKIFDPFFTTKDVGKGLGLGLSICQSIIEKHKGLITVESEVNTGTVFNILLPDAKELSTL
ncbi:MAG: ATP-binding protein [Candidatus Omnitrophota bacterium]|jgi:signal transduction histidine kinase